MSAIPPEADSPIGVLRDIVIDFINNMSQEKAMIEQQIRDKSEEIRTQYTQMGQSTFSFADFDNLARGYKDFFVNYYRNTIHLKLIAMATRKMKEGMEQGFAQAEIIREEVLMEFQKLQSIASEKGEIDARSEDLEKELLNQTEYYSDLQSENLRLQNEIQVLRAEASEKSSEYENLSSSMLQMENQLNILGQQMLESNTEIEDLQTALAEKDNEIAILRSQAGSRGALEQEIESLKGTIQEMTKRENELLANQSTTSNELFEQLQQELEKTRNELYQMKGERVERNEEIRRLKLELEETLIQMGVLTSFKDETENEMKKNREKIQTLEVEKEDFRVKYENYHSKAGEHEAKLNEALGELNKTKGELATANEALKTYEGKVSLSEEVKEGYEKSLDYFKKILSYDPKFRALAILDGVESEMQLKDLAIALGLPNEIVHRCLVELADAGYVSLRRDGKLTFAKTNNQLSSPFSLQTIFGEAGN